MSRLNNHIANALLQRQRNRISLQSLQSKSNDFSTRKFATPFALSVESHYFQSQTCLTFHIHILVATFIKILFLSNLNTIIHNYCFIKLHQGLTFLVLTHTCPKPTASRPRIDFRLLFPSGKHAHAMNTPLYPTFI